MRTALIRSLALTVFAAVWLSAVGVRAQTAPTFQQVLDGARAEGALTLFLYYPSEDADRRLLMAAFNKRFGLSLDIKWVDIHPTQVLQQLNTEGPAGRFSGDVADGNTDDFLPAVNHGWIKPFTWGETFGAALPALASTIPGEVPELRNVMLPYRDNSYVLAWNTQEATEASVPHRFDELADPRWGGRLAVDGIHMVPITLLTYAIGQDKVVDLIRRILANHPLLKLGGEAILSSVSGGEAAFGTTTFNAAELSIKRGEPIAYRAFDDYVPATTISVYVPANPPHPNAARLFAAWLVTEGEHLVEANEFMGRLDDPTSYMAGKLDPQIERTHAMVVRARSLQDYAAGVAVRGPVDRMISGQK